jgi:hypothetical protein
VLVFFVRLISDAKGSRLFERVTEEVKSNLAQPIFTNASRGELGQES